MPCCKAQKLYPPLWCLQSRALTTYIKRIYFPFMLREPEISAPAAGVQCALWAYDEPATAGTAAAKERLGTAVLIASLAELPAALEAAARTVTDSGGHPTTPLVPRCFIDLAKVNIIFN